MILPKCQKLPLLGHEYCQEKFNAIFSGTIQNITLFLTLLQHTNLYSLSLNVDFHILVLVNHSIDV